MTSSEAIGETEQDWVMEPPRRSAGVAAGSGRSAAGETQRADEGGALDVDSPTDGNLTCWEDLEACGRSAFRKYSACIREMQVRFEILDDDLSDQLLRNPIHHIESRLKGPASIYTKMQRYGVPLTLRSMEENILDIAGIRVICPYTDDVYHLIEMVGKQDDLEIVKVKDYIDNPKPNGYRSVHVIVKVPVYFMASKELVPVEVQFRTIAMDFWASLEHDLRYKAAGQVDGIDMADELKNCADIIQDVENRMQILMRAME